MTPFESKHPQAAVDAKDFTGDEGGLRAPPHLHGWRKAWWWFDFIILVKLARLRFIGVLVVIGIVITQWDTLTAYYNKWTRPLASNDAADSDIEYFCPMHPTIVRDNPKDKCPICFMPLSKRKKGDGTVEALPAGVVNRVQLSPYRVVLAGIHTWPVDYVPLAKEITAVGYIEFNERGQRTVSARVAGRIDKLFVNETGQMVKEGDDLASLYSPDLVVTVQNLRSASRNAQSDYFAGAKSKLQLLGIDDAQIEEILSAKEANTHLRIKSPISGHVIAKYVREGQYVQEGTPLYEVADLSTVWVQAQIYEDDLAFLPAGYQHGVKAINSSGLEVTATTRAFPDRVFHGTLDFISPHMDQETRTVTVRIELDNPGHELRPGSTANVTLKIRPKDLRMFSELPPDTKQAAMLQEGMLLAVPESSVIDTGSQRIVYRETAPNTFEGTEVGLGPNMTSANGTIFYPVLRGVDEGDRVVTSGSFLVDAETRLNPTAGSIYFGGSSGKGSAGASSHVRPSTPEDMGAKVQAGLAKLSLEDRRLAEAQHYCPILSDSLLGSMGKPFKVVINDRPVFLCCDGCKKDALADPSKTLARVDQLLRGETLAPSASADDEEAEIASALAALLESDRQAAIAQKYCPILEDNRLGSMGTPVKVTIDGQDVYLCCKLCKEDALANPKATLAKAARMKAEASHR